MPAAITAIITASCRPEQTLVTIGKIHECRPCPDEIIVHIDCGHDVLRAVIEQAFPGIKILTSTSVIGPGGARNRLIAAARHEIVASFDDDSYPIDTDYFARLERLFARFPDAAVFAAQVFVRGEPPPPGEGETMWVANFAGCANACRKAAFLQTAGYVPLQVAYGMEESDVALQLHVLGLQILHASSLRVYHDTDYRGHRSPNTVACTIANTALFGYLRYPPVAWPRAIMQTCLSAIYAFRQGRRRGIVSGFLMIPYRLWSHRQYRRTVSARVLHSYLELRRNPRNIA